MNGDWIQRRAPWLLVALVLLLLVPGTASLPIVDRDEPRFATATREMIERADWVIPTFNGNYRFDKPVLTYWLMRVGYGVFGIGEFGARVHAIAATLVLVLATWWAGRRWFGPAVGLAAAAMLASCVQVFIHGRLALADMPMIAAVVVACVAIPHLLEGGRKPFLKNPAWWALYLALGIGFLAKGPLVLAVPVLALLLHRFAFWRRSIEWSRLGLAPGLLVSLVIIAAWGIPALVATQGLFWKVGMGEHVVQRGYDRFNGRGYTPFFYLATAPLSLFPWFAFLGLLPWAARRRWSERTAWLVSWAVAPYLIFTAYATQLPHYVLPAFPAVFLILGLGVTEPTADWPRWARRAAWCFASFCAAVFLLALGAVQWAVLPVEVFPLRDGFFGLFLVMLGFALLPLAALAVRDTTKTWARRMVLGLALALVASGAGVMARGLRQTSLTAHLAGRFDRLPPDTRFVGAGFSEPSLVFYTSRRWVFPQSAEELDALVRQPGPLVLVSVKEECDPIRFFGAGLQQRLGRPAQVRMKPGPKEFAASLSALENAAGWEAEELTGFNLGRTRWQRLRIATRP